MIERRVELSPCLLRPGSQRRLTSQEILRELVTLSGHGRSDDSASKNESITRNPAHEKRDSQNRESRLEQEERRLQVVAAHRLTRGQRAGRNYLPLFLIETERCDVALSPAASLTVSVTVTV